MQLLLVTQSWHSSGAESRCVPVLGLGQGCCRARWDSVRLDELPRVAQHSNTGCNSLSHRFRIGNYCGAGTRAVVLALVPPTAAANKLWQ